MKILIITKSGREYVIETSHETIESFMQEEIIGNPFQTWLNFGKKETCVYSGDLVIKKDEIELFLFNYKNTITGEGY